MEFPRSQNTCTRCPAIVRLQPDPSVTEPYALIGTDESLKPNSNGTRKVEIGNIGKTIESLTKELVEDKGLFISENPIHIMLVRNCGPAFTLIDLPGKV